MLRNLLITMFLLNFTLVALAGEWSKEELELEAKKKKEYAIKSQEYKRKAFEYKLFLEIAEKHYGYDRKCGNDGFLVSGFIRRLYCHAKTIITYKNAEKFCRNNKCGIVTTEYSEDHLNNIDMENITLIKSIERNRMKN